MSRYEEVFLEISPADFFYRNRDIAGFSNPARAMYSTVRELIENSLDACELHQIPPDIYVRISHEKNASSLNTFRIRVTDNGSGIPPKYIPSAFGQVLFGSKFRLRQSRGTFGLGGKMAILYGQITTHSPVYVISSTGTSYAYEFKLMIDIQQNKPIILKKKQLPNRKIDGKRWHGTIVEFCVEGNYLRAMPKILEYFKQTAIVSPYANITFVDPRGRLYRFGRATKKMPKPPKETLPHPHGVDVETLQRIIHVTNQSNMHDFMTNHFHRVGKNIAKRFLEFARIDAKENPKNLKPHEVVRLVHAMKKFNGFLPPDANCLSPLGEKLFETGIRKELNPEFVAVVQRKPSAYSGFPFIIEVSIAYGGNIPQTGSILLYRFANRIPLLYDEASDVTWKVVHTMINWKRYKVAQEHPVAIAVHVCSTKIPYKTVGKEFIADRPEVQEEILNGIRETGRQLRRYLTRKEDIKHAQKRLDIFSKYLPKIAYFSTNLAGKTREPDIEPLLRSLTGYEKEEENEKTHEEKEEIDN